MSDDIIANMNAKSLEENHIHLKALIEELEAKLAKVTEERDSSRVARDMHRAGEAGWATRARAAEAKLAKAVENAFKQGLRYSITVKISDEHDIQTAWDWSSLKQNTLAAIKEGE
jgi:peptidoglycan hydrolase CwlO-like protein